MKVYLVLAPLVGSLLCVLSFTSVPHAEGRPGNAYPEFLAECHALHRAAQAVQQGHEPFATLRTRVAAARHAYKRIAWLTDYYYPAYVAKHLNGAPLLKAEKYGTHSSVVPPEGLQVLDEMAFADSPDPSQFAILARTLVNHAAPLAPELAGRSFPLPEVVEAMRLELVRIPTLYLTGFDTPGSLDGIAESAESLAALRTLLQKQTALTVHPAHAAILASLDAAIDHLRKHPDFDSFDRLAFQRDHLNGLYRTLGTLQREAGLPATVKMPTGRDPEGQSLYSDDFLDPYSFTRLAREDDSPELRALGQTLFYDTGLSRAGNLSCASCHRPDRAFTDGADGVTARNAPTLINAVYADRFFYDLRAFTLEQQAEHVIYDHGEFDTDYGELLAKLRGAPAYRRQFRAAFGSAIINKDNFRAALASYVLSLRSFNSPFDRYARGDTDHLPESARAGFNLFMGKAGCGTCHFAPTFSGLVPPNFTENESEILGVLARPYAWQPELSPDRGRAAGGTPHEDVWIFDRSFKTPTVRNAALTAPYFHHGAYPTLESVIDFYNLGGGAGAGLAVNNQTLPSEPLSLSKTEKADLIAFMESLTDVPEKIISR